MLKALLFAALAVPVAVGVSYAAQSKTAATHKVNLVVPNAPAENGHATYLAYCASCHGADARGNGPVAKELNHRPADLTQLAKLNRGEYPALRVVTALESGTIVPAHGTPSMPVWGPVFTKFDRDDAPVIKLRISNLSGYLRTIQEK